MKNKTFSKWFVFGIVIFMVGVFTMVAEDAGYVICDYYYSGTTIPRIIGGAGVLVGLVTKFGF